VHSGNHAAKTTANYGNAYRLFSFSQGQLVLFVK
jgi:ATP:corrinoid adenosyltransferase